MRKLIAAHCRAPAHPGLVFLAWVLGVCVLVLAVIRNAGAEWKPEYAQASPEVQAWYRNAELTPEAQKRFPFKKCCDHADVFRTQFKVDKASGRDEWWYFDMGEWKRVPDDIVHIDEHAPDNQPTLFIYNGKETCFFPGGAGG